MENFVSPLSIVVPTLNEAENIHMLVKRIDESLVGAGISYEIIFVDDKSKDDTLKKIEELQSQYPISYATKSGPQGKAFSLLQGFRMAQYDVICMIDADLQYPPEAIAPMYTLMQDTGVDLILTERIEQETSFLRQLSSKVFNFLFTRLLFGFHYDSQSGLKLFRKTVINKTKLNPTPWSFDLEFIVRALENNAKILSYQIPFSTRFSGETKVRVFKLTYELAKASLKLRATSSPKKVKRAYRMNLKLANQVNALLMLFVFATLTSVFVSSSSSAISVPVNTTIQNVVALPTSLTQQLIPITTPTNSNSTVLPLQQSQVTPRTDTTGTDSSSRTSQNSAQQAPINSSGSLSAPTIAKVGNDINPKAITYPSPRSISKANTTYTNGGKHNLRVVLISLTTAILVIMIIGGVAYSRLISAN